MAKFCGKCGTRLDADLGLCPNCDQAEIERRKRIPNFCIFCGAKMNKQTGICPICGKDAMDEESTQVITPIQPAETMAPVQPVEPVEPVTPATPVWQEEPTVRGQSPWQAESSQEIESLQETEPLQPMEAVQEPVYSWEEDPSERTQSIWNAEPAEQVWQQPAQATEQTRQSEETVQTQSIWQADAKQRNETVYQAAPTWQQPMQQDATHWQNQMQQTMQEENVPKHKKKTPVLDAIITVLISICLFIMSFVAITIFCVRQSTTEQGAEKILDNIEWSDLTSEVYLIDAEDNELVHPYDYIRSYLNETAGISITERQLESFLEESTLKSFFAEKIASYADTIYTDGGKFRLTKREVVSVLNDNADILYDEIGKEVPDEVLEQLISNFIDEDFLDQVSVDSIKESSPELYYVLHYGLSYITMAIFIVLALCFIFILWSNNKSQGLMGTGITFIFMGAVLTVLAGMATWFPDVWASICGGSTIGLILGQVLSINIILFAVLLVIGVLVLVTRKLILNYIRR